VTAFGVDRGRFERCSMFALAKRLQDSGEPPVHDEHLTERAHHDVGRLQVTVDHPALVSVRDRLAGAPDYVQHAGLGPTLLLLASQLENTPQRQALDQAHRVVQRPVLGDPQVVDRHDALVIELGGDLGFLEKAGHHLALVALVSGSAEELEGNRPPKLAVVGLDHAAHPASSDLAADLVAFAEGGLATKCSQEVLECRRLRRGRDSLRRRMRGSAVPRQPAGSS